MARTITLRYRGNCAECGTQFYPGDVATWLGRGTLVCAEGCGRVEEPLGQTLSRHDPHGVYTPNGRRIGSSCSCEDYPCCGH